jgi:NDP-sugar pyrophosphorylase family protein
MALLIGSSIDRACAVRDFMRRAFSMASSESLPVVILAGGLATRLRPKTDKVPKALIEVAGKPFIEHQLELLRQNGVRDVVLCVGYLGEMIAELYGGGTKLGVNLTYSYDGDELLGTGGAIRKATPLLPASFFVLYGDSYLPIDYQAIARAFSDCGEPALMTVFKNRDAWDTSNVWFADSQVRLYSKKRRLPEMQHIDYGLTVFRREMFERWSGPRCFDLATVLESLSEQSQLAGYEVFRRFYEIGSLNGLAELDELLRRNKNPAEALNPNH